MTKSRCGQCDFHRLEWQRLIGYTHSCSAWWRWRCKCLKFSNVPQSIVSKASYSISSPFALNLDMNRVFYEKKKLVSFFFSTSNVTSVDSYVCINFANPKGIHWEFYNENITTYRSPSHVNVQDKFIIRRIVFSIFVQFRTNHFDWQKVHISWINKFIVSEIMCGKVFIFFICIPIQEHKNRYDLLFCMTQENKKRVCHYIIIRNLFIKAQIQSALRWKFLF